MPPGHDYPITPPPPPTTSEPTKTDWVHRHPYGSALIALGGLAFIVLGIVGSRSGVTQNTNGSNWVGAGSVFSTGRQQIPEAERLAAGDTVKQNSTEVELGYIPITSPLEGIVDEEKPTLTNDLADLLAQLAQPAPQGSELNLENSTAFSFIPQGLITVSSPTGQKSPEAEALHSYGNTVATYIQSFESSHLNAIQTLKDHAEDRENPEKAAQAERLGYDLAELGRDLLLIEDVPEEIQAAHSALATSYRIVGTNLTKVAASQTDEEFLEAINTYNASVESLAKRYLVIVGIFSANNVTFSSSDAGSMFTFNAAPSF